jgi:YidC/Oxa1 family membrane protein insertase
MELYRKHNINPLGGCLPMFLQMPIFIALYMTLVRSFELKGATFLRIKDLSAPDAIFKLPFKLPFLGEQLNLLPILMIVAMVIQQRVSTYKRGKTDPQVEQQQKMMLMMPLLFGIIFYSLPSGLVLYWLVNTVFMILVQLHIARTMPPVEMVSG